jgi:DNA-binding PadR family transcriptional regulator
MTYPSRPRSPLWMVVLSMVSEEPMHPYRMQALIKERGKDQIANVAQRNSVYQTIAALLRARLIAIRETSRDERRPERTVYEVTTDGRQVLRSWMRTVLSSPAREFPDFPAALSLVAAAAPDEVRSLLETRIGALEGRLAELEKPVPNLPRLFLLEAEYAAAVVRAEIQWLRGVTSDLRSGRLRWSDESLRRVAAEWASGGGGGPAAQAHGAAPPGEGPGAVAGKPRRAAVARPVRRSRKTGRRR